LAFADLAGWIAAYYCPGFHVFEYYSVAADNRTIVDGDAESYGSVGGYPYAVAYDNLTTYQGMVAAVDVM